MKRSVSELKDCLNANVVAWVLAIGESLFLQDVTSIRCFKQVCDLELIFIVEDMIECALEILGEIRPRWHCLLTTQCLIGGSMSSLQIIALIGRAQAPYQRLHHSVADSLLEELVDLTVLLLRLLVQS